MSNKLFWIYKKGVFGSGDNKKKYGEEIKLKDVGGEDRMAQFIKDGKVGEILGSPVSEKSNSEISELKNKITELKENFNKQLKDVNAEWEDKLKLAAESFDEKLKLKDNEIEGLKKK